jgi:hypothetical protein
MKCPFCGSYSNIEIIGDWKDEETGEFGDVYYYYDCEIEFE